MIREHFSGVRCAWRRMALLAAGLLVTGAAHAAYPDKPVHLVVGFAPGGADISARIVALKLSQLWGQQIVVDNKPGAAGNIGADIVSKAAPDGYTLLLAINSYTINTSVYRGLQWDLMRDFTAIGRYGATPLVVVVNDNFPAKSMSELMAYAKANPGKLNYGSTGAGTAPHLAVEQFAQATGLALTHIPYKGSAPLALAVLAGEVQLAFGALSAYDNHIKSGKLRALAVTTAERQEALKDVPTIREATGVDIDADIWYGLIAPAKTPPDIVRKISEDLRKALADPDTQVKLRDAGVVPAFLNPADTEQLMQRDVVRWRNVAQRIKLSLD